MGITFKSPAIDRVTWCTFLLYDLSVSQDCQNKAAPNLIIN